jgi:hypothetical protein
MRHRRYGVLRGRTLTVFSERLEAALAYWQICFGSVLVYKASGKWGGQPERSVRWLRVPVWSCSLTLEE